MAVRACPVTDQFQNQEVAYTTFSCRLANHYTGFFGDPNEVRETIAGIFEKDDSFTRTMRDPNPKIPPLKQRAVELRLQESLPPVCNCRCIKETVVEGLFAGAALTALWALCYGYVKMGGGFNF